MSIFKFITTSQLRKVLSAIHQRFTGVENNVEEVEEKINTLETRIDNEDFVVTLVSTENRVNRKLMFSKDKTYAEILTAYNSGKKIIGNISSSGGPSYCYFNFVERLFISYDFSETDLVKNMYCMIIDSNEEAYSLTDSLPTIEFIENLTTYMPPKRQIALINGNDSGDSIEFNTNTATQAYSTGDLFWRSIFDLAKATTDIASGATLTENINYVNTTIADELKSAGSQSDWEEADTTDSFYILNKPPVKAGDGENSVMIGQLDVPLEELEPSATLLVTGDAKATTYTYTTEDNLSGLTRVSTVAVYNNKVYSLAASIDTTNNTITFTSTLSITAAVTNAEIKLYKMKKIVVGTYATAEGIYTAASGTYSHAEGSNTRAIGSSSHSEGNSTSSVGTASHAEGGSTTAPGTYSHAEGFYATASGNYSHAEGHYTTASGNPSHAEGSRTIASGAESHAEGLETTASGVASHSEGGLTKASGDASHAEGYYSVATHGGAHAEGWKGTSSVTLAGEANALTYTVTDGPYLRNANRSTTMTVEYNSAFYPVTAIVLNSSGILTSVTLESTLNDSAAVSGNATIHIGNLASGMGAHAEGEATHAAGPGSHAEGLNTIAVECAHAEGSHTLASSSYQHVQGKHNIEDSNGVYAHIVGNGTSSEARSNAHTLDWNGNGWYAGKLTVGTGPTNNMDVATKQYVDNAVSGGGGSSTLVDLTDTTITSPTNGQTLVYNSTASKWENQDSNFVVTITYSGSGDNLTYTADKTFDATYEAYTSGKRIYAVLANAIYTLAGATSSTIVFSRNTESTLTCINWSKSSNTITRSNKMVTLVNLTDTSITSPTNGQTLVYNSTTSKWENTSIPKEVMVVTMTSTGSGDNITYSADKTYSEILTHINNGGTPIVYYHGNCYHLNYFDSYDEEICFSFSYLSSGGLVIFAEYVYISSNGSNFANCNTQRLDVSLGISGNVIQLKNGDNTVMSSVTLPVYNGGVSS